MTNVQNYDSFRIIAPNQVFANEAKWNIFVLEPHKTEVTQIIKK
jgi:hypothetical protein